MIQNILRFTLHKKRNIKKHAAGMKLHIALHRPLNIQKENTTGTQHNYKLHSAHLMTHYKNNVQKTTKGHRYKTTICHVLHYTGGSFFKTTLLGKECALTMHSFSS